MKRIIVFMLGLFITYSWFGNNIAFAGDGFWDIDALISGWTGTTAKRIKIDTNGNLISVPGTTEGAWTTARTNVVANDTATTYGTADTGNFSVNGYSHYRAKFYANATTNSFNVQCGACTPTTSPDYGYIDAISLTGRGVTEPYLLECDTDGQTVAFIKFTNLSSGANITKVEVQAFN